VRASLGAVVRNSGDALEEHPARDANRTSGSRAAKKGERDGEISRAPPLLAVRVTMPTGDA
jgi:hypothetical protein